MASYSDAQLRHAFDQVRVHVMELHARWKLFRKLYRGNAESVPVLTEVGSEMFWVLGRLLHRGCFLLFRQLLDPPVSMGNRNASLEGLLAELAGPDYKANHSDLMRLIDDLRSRKAIREHVNKYIAHLDLDLLAGASTPPAPVGILDFDDALRLMRAFVAVAGERFVPDCQELDFEAGGDLMSEQAEGLVELLRKALGHSSPAG